MEFPSRKKCIEYYQEQFPELPRYMVEMALDYDLTQGEGSSSNEKPLTGKAKRKQKQSTKQQQQAKPREREINETIQDALATGKRIEIDCAQVVKGEDYVMPPFIEGHIELDGNAVWTPENEPEPSLEEVENLGEIKSKSS
jgi:hypothetical protein